VKVFSYNSDKGISQIGIEFEGGVYNFSQAWELYRDIKNKGRGPGLEFLQIMVEADFFHAETFDQVFSTLRSYRPLKDLMIDGPVNFQLPVGRPQKILGIGRNYREHAAELSNPVPSEPIFFSKSPSALLPHQHVIQLPPDVGRVDAEAELAVVIGRVCHDVSEKHAMDFVAGFSIVNDVTARDMQRKDIEAKKPWFRSKNFDTFCPFGPYLVPKEKFDSNVNVCSRINGAERQNSPLSDMIFPVTELVAYLSKHCTLVPGDIIATGTPSGVTPLTPGDVIECEISGLGILSNSVQ
jgi:2-keto-4-pentenoate hydratase/2-oxohepta-3-ene-1,7-dioic acid hydratase in catechol pathway